MNKEDKLVLGTLAGLDLILSPEHYEEYKGTLQDQLEESYKEIDRLNNIINETRRILGQYAHYSTPTEEQNAKNEAIVDEAYIKLHGNVAKGLKEEGNKE